MSVRWPCSSDGLIQADDLGLEPAESTKALEEKPAAPETDSTPAISNFALNLPDLTNGLPMPLPAFLDEVERELILRALAQTGNNRTQAAHLLGITFRQLRYQIQRLSINAPEA